MRMLAPANTPSAIPIADPALSRELCVTGAAEGRVGVENGLDAVDRFVTGNPRSDETAEIADVEEL